MQSKKLIEIRNALELFMKGLQNEGVLPSSIEIATLFKKRQSKIAEAASEDLIVLALTRLVVDVSVRKSHHNWTKEQNELFGGISGVPNTIVVLNKTKNGVKKSKLVTPLATYSQLVSWLENDSRELRSRKSRHADLNDKLKALKPYFVSEKTTFEEALKAAGQDKKRNAA